MLLAQLFRRAAGGRHLSLFLAWGRGVVMKKKKKTAMLRSTDEPVSAFFSPPPLFTFFTTRLPHIPP
jgi:hypothetical protein